MIITILYFIPVIISLILILLLFKKNKDLKKKVEQFNHCQNLINDDIYNQMEDLYDIL